MRKTFVMRGQTASGETEILNFGKYKQGYAYRLTEFDLYPSTNVGQALIEMTASITAGKTAITPTDPNFNDDGLIATALFVSNTSGGTIPGDFYKSVINDTYIITQNLILMVQAGAGSSADPINWQCRFESVKMSGPEEASVNYKQFAISDE
jgi:hypothetical protein